MTGMSLVTGMGGEQIRCQSVTFTETLPSPLWQGEHVQYVNANYNENGKLIIESVVMMAITTVKRK